MHGSLTGTAVLLRQTVGVMGDERIYGLTPEWRMFGYDDYAKTDKVFISFRSFPAFPGQTVIRDEGGTEILRCEIQGREQRLTPEVALELLGYRILP